MPSRAAAVAECVPIGVMDFPELVEFAKANRVDLVVPGPEAPLVAGIGDAMAAAGIACCGPDMAASRLEGSKTFANEICDAAGIPTAKWERFEEIEAARAFVRRRGTPIVIKADGLAAGKGVVVAATEAEALDAIDSFMERRVLGDAGAAVVIEECLTGEEVSLFALCDGRSAMLLGSAQDHKRVREGDVGANTGGMGAYAPVPAFPPAMEQLAVDRFILPVLAEMDRRGTPFRGVLFAGLMLTDDGPKLIEFNVRFGDPECQVLLARLHSDLLPALQAACDGELANFDLRFLDISAIAVVMAARGYPDAPERDGEIKGLERAAAVSDVQVLHAGTEQDADGRIRAMGGRVLTICATGDTLKHARDRAYEAVDRIEWPTGFCRRDIGWRALNA